MIGLNPKKKLLLLKVSFKNKKPHKYKHFSSVVVTNCI